MIDLDEYRGMTRIMYPPNKRMPVFGLPSHKLKPMVTSGIFSPPARIIEIDTGGSLGKQALAVENWGTGIGPVDRIESRRRAYEKRDRIDGVFSITELKSQLTTRGVKDPVVRYIYMVRSTVDTNAYDEMRQGIYMLWCYTHHFKDRVVGLSQLRDLDPLCFEGHYTFDLYAASGPDITLESEDMGIAIQQAHDDLYLYNMVRPALLFRLRSAPLVCHRVDYPEAPRVISEPVPIAIWTP